MELAKKIVFSILIKDFSCFETPHTNQLTDNVREEFEKLSLDQYHTAIANMEEMLINVYASKEEKFLLKENLIYYLGRSKNINYELLKKIYFKEENMHLKLNLFFSLLSSFDEEVEFDFIDKISPGNEMDKMIRSWTMAFFANSDNPYEYIDTGKDDPSLALKARLDRFVILLNENNPKYKKALAYLYIDLMVILLFINSRSPKILNDFDYQIVSEIPEYFDEFSNEKNQRISEVKKIILNKRMNK